MDTSLSDSPADIRGLVANVMIADKGTPFSVTLDLDRPLNRRVYNNVNT